MSEGVSIAAQVACLGCQGANNGARPTEQSVIHQLLHSDQRTDGVDVEDLHHPLCRTKCLRHLVRDA